MKTRRRNLTGANRGNGGRNQSLCSVRLLAIYRSYLLFNLGSRGVVQLDFDKSISDGVPPSGIYAKRDGAADSVFLACRAEVGRRRKSDGFGPYTDNCLPSIALAAEGANIKPSMSKATPRLVCSATTS